MIQDNIKSRRLELGLTLEQLGQRVGVTRATIHRYESGDIHNIDTMRIQQLADALFTTPGRLIGWDQTKPAESVKVQTIAAMCSTLDDDNLNFIIDFINRLR